MQLLQFAYAHLPALVAADEHRAILPVVHVELLVSEGRVILAAELARVLVDSLFSLRSTLPLAVACAAMTRAKASLRVFGQHGRKQ